MKMIGKIWKFFGVLAVAAALLSNAPASEAAARLDMLGGVVHVTLESGRMLPIEGLEPEKIKRGGETVYYVRTDGDGGPVAEGLRQGIYFFDRGGRRQGFVSCESFGGSEFCYPIFSPDGETLALDFGTYAVRSFSVYKAEANAESFEFTGLATFDSVSTPAWLDGSRLIYNSFEPNKPASDAREYKTSVCIYDIALKKQTVLARHTATSDYAVEFDYENEDPAEDEAKPAVSGSSVRVVRTYVDNPSEWNDFEKLKQETIMMEIPK